MTESQFLRQHISVGDGWPHDRWGDKFYVNKNTGAGYAKCTCGQMSEDELDSTRQRRMWQREHRVTMLTSFLERQAVAA